MRSCCYASLFWKRLFSCGLRLAVFLFALTGCSTINNDRPSWRVLSYIPSVDDEERFADEVFRYLNAPESIGIQGTRPASSAYVSYDEEELATRNALLANYVVREESPFYSCMRSRHQSCARPPLNSIAHNARKPILPRDEAWPAGLPRMCIALSGGGVRSAMFSLGVMQALAKAGLLDQADVVSGVSGGGYALSWLLLTKINEQVRTGRIMNASELLSEEMELIEGFATNAPFIPKTFSLLTAIANLVNRPVEILGGSSGMGNDPYWSAIYASFLAGACRDCQADGQLPLSELAGHLYPHRLPYPVFGLSARTPEEGVCNEQTRPRTVLEESYFEISPLRQGIPGHYTDTGLALDLGDVAALSGAAVSPPEAQYCAAAEFLGQNLGTWISYLSRSHIPTPRQVPTAAHEAQGIKRTRLFLADGGHVENLGFFPLLQRLCQTIVVVDGEHDPNLRFEALGRLEEFLATRGISWTTPLVNSAERSPASYFKDNEFAADQLDDPVFRGRLGLIPYRHVADDENGEGYVTSLLHLDVHYVKLSFDARRVALAEPTACAAYSKSGAYDQAQYCNEKLQFAERNLKWGCFGITCPFPQYSTIRQDLGRNEMRALHTLGMRLGEAIVAHEP